MIIHAKQIKKKHFERLIDKLNDDEEHLREEFKSVMRPKVLDETLNIIENLIDCLERGTAFIIQPCKELRQVLGRGFTAQFAVPIPFPLSYLFLRKTW